MTQEHRELWQEIRVLQTENASLRTEMQAGFAEIKSMLQERCEARVAWITKIEQQVARNTEDINKLLQLRAQIFVVATLGSIIGGAVVGWLLK